MSHSFRQLHNAILAYNGDFIFSELLLPWGKANPSAQAWLKAFNEREGSPFPQAEEEDLWNLYALSRVCDLLLLQFQMVRSDPSAWTGPRISVEEFVAFVELLGMTVVWPTKFLPVYHEVVELESGDDVTGVPEIIAYRWPCVMLGRMIMVRGGVSVSAGSGTFAPGIADQSTLYWAYRRKGRPYQDLSHGWGSNSQWRTSFRRDYVIGNAWYFNVDGTRDLAVQDQDAEVEESDTHLTLEERIELLTHRCFVKSTKPHSDLWPYDDCLKLGS